MRNSRLKTAVLYLLGGLVTAVFLLPLVWATGISLRAPGIPPAGGGG